MNEAVTLDFILGYLPFWFAVRCLVVISRMQNGDLGGIKIGNQYENS